jgi:quercetin dioxygenase-like cupin family protein
MTTPRVLRSPTLEDRVIVLVDPADSAGELFRFEYVARSVTAAPPDHMHTDQEERVEVLEGTLHCRIAGHERVLRPGDRLVIPPGTSHTLWNADPSGSRSIGEFTPALHALAMFETVFDAV